MNDAKYIGLDVHQAMISAVVLDSSGRLVMESILETKASTILQFIRGLRGSLQVTLNSRKIPIHTRSVFRSESIVRSRSAGSPDFVTYPSGPNRWRQLPSNRGHRRNTTRASRSPTVGEYLRRSHQQSCLEDSSLTTSLGRTSMSFASVSAPFLAPKIPHSGCSGAKIPFIKRQTHYRLPR